MAKLSTLKTGLRTVAAPLSATITSEAQRDAQRMRNEPWRKWYKTKQWTDLRMQVLIRDLFKCKYCSITHADTSKLVCDHITPHRGNEALFWSGPFQTLCATCHSSKKQKFEKSGRKW